jgi:hypothetical protein
MLSGDELTTIKVDDDSGRLEKSDSDRLEPDSDASLVLNDVNNGRADGVTNSDDTDRIFKVVTDIDTVPVVDVAKFEPDSVVPVRLAESGLEASEYSEPLFVLMVWEALGEVANVEPSVSGEDKVDMEAGMSDKDIVWPMLAELDNVIKLVVDGGFGDDI